MSLARFSATTNNQLSLSLCLLLFLNYFLEGGELNKPLPPGAAENRTRISAWSLVYLATAIAFDRFRDNGVVGSVVGWMVGRIVGLMVEWVVGWIVGWMVGWVKVCA